VIDPAIVETDLRVDEGRRDRPYKDTKGLLTIGYGHNLVAEGLCQAAMDAQLHYDYLTKAVNPLTAHLPWWQTQPEPVQRVLGNLAFNMGIQTLLTLTQFLNLVKTGSYAAAAADLRATAYAKQVGDRAERLATLLDGVTV